MNTELDKQIATAGTPVSIGWKRATWLRKSWPRPQLTALCTFKQKPAFHQRMCPFPLAFMGCYSVAELRVRMSVMPWVLIVKDGKCEEAMGRFPSAFGTTCWRQA